VQSDPSLILVQRIKYQQTSDTDEMFSASDKQIGQVAHLVVSGWSDLDHVCRVADLRRISGANCRNVVIAITAGSYPAMS
jgi:hypothetical protein